MTKDQLPRYRSGDHHVDEAIEALVEQAGVARSEDLTFEMIVSAIRLGREIGDRGDLKLVSAALKELRYSMSVFEPYRDVRKLSIFGSARTPPEHPTYQTASDLGAAVVEQDWMVITGAGPGIMTAGVEGAGAEDSFGVGITLPFEERAARTIEDDPKLINFKYFFTRKLTFMKESHGFALLPGGFGTLDESFELLTLLQTGKTVPAPVVLLDAPGGDYWQGWHTFVTQQLLSAGLISADDMCLVTVTDSVEEAVDEICGFYRRYHSLRFVGRRLVIRLSETLDDDLMGRIEADHGHLLRRGGFELIEATEQERRDDDYPQLPRLAFEFNRRDYAGLRRLIDTINGQERT